MSRDRYPRRGRGGRGTFSDRYASNPRGTRSTEGSTFQDGDICGMCSFPTQSDAIGCDTCDKWYHPNPTCVGLPVSVITSIKDYGGAGISFSCSDCRISNLSGNDNAPMKKMFASVKSLVETVNILKDQVKLLMDSSRGSNVSNNAVPSAPTTDSLRVSIREEIREMEEQKKRSSSLIIRGLQATNCEQALGMAKNVLGFVADRNVDVSDMVIIDPNKKLFRCKVLDSEMRKLIIDNAKKLKGSQYNNIYVNKDLTYKQRMELFRRREQRRSQSLNRPGIENNANEAAGTGVSLNV